MHGERLRREAPTCDSLGSHARFQLAPERSAILIGARSTVGPIEFGMTGLEGFVHVRLVNGGIDLESDPTAHVELQVEDLRSGNQLYDAELLRRIDARRYPTVVIDLRAGSRATNGDRYQLEGEVTFHGVHRVVNGSVTASALGERGLVVDGEQTFDIRDFDVATPTMLMLKIYPDVRVRLHVEADILGTAAAETTKKRSA